MLPDFTWDFEESEYVVVFEFDENAHRQYEVRCEFARAFKLAVGYKRPIYLIRFNCDGLPFVKDMPELNDRLPVLKSRLLTAMMRAVDDSQFEYAVIIDFLYYYDIPGSTATAPFLQTLKFATHDECELWATATIAELESQTHRAVTRALADADDAFVAAD
jgi:hypothetical protein